jgi:hypothetical protein
MMVCTNAILIKKQVCLSVFYCYNNIPEARFFIIEVWLAYSSGGSRALHWLSCTTAKGMMSDVHVRRDHTMR